MKVLITTDWYKPVINGVVTSVISLLDGLTALGADGAYSYAFQGFAFV